MFEKTMLISGSDLMDRLQRHPGMEPLSTLPEDVMTKIENGLCDILSPGLEICMRSSIDSLIEMNKGSIERMIVETLSGPSRDSDGSVACAVPPSNERTDDDGTQPSLRTVTKDVIDAFNATRKRNAAVFSETSSEDMEGPFKDKEHEFQEEGAVTGKDQ